MVFKNVYKTFEYGLFNVMLIINFLWIICPFYLHLMINNIDTQIVWISQNLTQYFLSREWTTNEPNTFTTHCIKRIWSYSVLPHGRQSIVAITRNVVLSINYGIENYFQMPLRFMNKLTMSPQFGDLKLWRNQSTIIIKKNFNIVWIYYYL